MTRLLVPTNSGLASGQIDDREFLSRLGKFIPSETGTLFTIVNAYLTEELGLKAGGIMPPPFIGIGYMGWAIITFLVCFSANVLLLNRMYDKQFAGNALLSALKGRHIFASSIGFIIWAYAIKSPIFSDYYRSFAVVLLIGIFLIIVKNIKAPVEESNPHTRTRASTGKSK